jgi:hypothetical protein
MVGSYVLGKAEELLGGRVISSAIRQSNLELTDDELPFLVVVGLIKPRQFNSNLTDAQISVTASLMADEFTQAAPFEDVDLQRCTEEQVAELH